MNFLNRVLVSLCGQTPGLVMALELIEAEIKKQLLAGKWRATKNTIQIPWTGEPVNPGAITIALATQGWQQPLVEYVISAPHQSDTRSLRIVLWNH